MNRIPKIKQYNIWIVIGVLVALFIVFSYTSANKQKIKLCQKECVYIPEKEPGGGRYRSYTGDYWRWKSKNFARQEQCIDYCITQE